MKIFLDFDGAPPHIVNSYMCLRDQNQIQDSDQRERTRGGQRFRERERKGERKEERRGVNKGGKSIPYRLYRIDSRLR